MQSLINNVHDTVHLPLITPSEAQEEQASVAPDEMQHVPITPKLLTGF